MNSKINISQIKHNYKQNRSTYVNIIIRRIKGYVLLNKVWRKTFLLDRHKIFDIAEIFLKNVGGTVKETFIKRLYKIKSEVEYINMEFKSGLKLRILNKMII